MILRDVVSRDFSNRTVTALVQLENLTFYFLSHSFSLDITNNKKLKRSTILKKS